MIRVVLDTNIVISAALRSGSLPETVINLALNKEVQLCISEPILAEYKDVMSRPHLAIDPRRAALALKRIRDAARLLLPPRPSPPALTPTTTFFSNAPRLLKRITSLPAINVIIRVGGRRRA